MMEITKNKVMKANEAPEKIYINDFGSELSYDWHTEHCCESDIEYVREDAFIEKACEVFCKVCKIPNCRSNECKWISDFKGHLETI